MGLIPQGASMDNEGNSYLLDSSHYKPGSDYAASVSSETSSENNLPDHDTEDASSSSTKDSRTKSNGSGKRARKLLTLEQSRVLHELLQQTCFPSTQVREAVAAQLGLSPRKVQVFFQNKRQKQRKRSNLSTSQPKETTPQALMQSRFSLADPTQEISTESSNIPRGQVDSSETSPVPRILPRNHSNIMSTAPNFESHLHRTHSHEVPSSLPWIHRLADHRRFRDRHPPYWRDRRYERMEPYKYVPLKDRSSVVPAPYFDLLPGREPSYSTHTASRVLPPIVSDIRSSTTKLPSIDELVSHSAS